MVVFYQHVQPGRELTVAQHFRFVAGVIAETRLVF